tara:strand:+ start:39028 stop:39402 length:375 start_codon:yes stop_codon:yes gene_type:complete
MLEIGRVCVKIAGRLAGNYCVVVDLIDDTFVLVDGQMKRKRCNIAHLEPTKDIVKIKKDASHAEVVKALAALKIVVVDKKSKTPKSEKPSKKRKIKEKKEVKPKEVKKKEEPKKKELEKTPKKK